MVDEDSHSTDVSVSGQKVIQQLYWLITSFDFNWGQSCLATLVTKIALKCLEFLLLLYNLHILASDQKKVFVFSSNFLKNSGKHFEKSRTTCRKLTYTLFPCFERLLLRFTSLVAPVPTVWISGSLYFSVKRPTYPSPKPTLTLTSPLVQNDLWVLLNFVAQLL